MTSLFILPKILNMKVKSYGTFMSMGAVNKTFLGELGTNSWQHDWQGNYFYQSTSNIPILGSK